MKKTSSRRTKKHLYAFVFALQAISIVIVGIKVHKEQIGPVSAIQSINSRVTHEADNDALAIVLQEAYFDSHDKDFKSTLKDLYIGGNGLASKLYADIEMAENGDWKAPLLFSLKHHEKRQQGPAAKLLETMYGKPNKLTRIDLIKARKYKEIQKESINQQFVFSLKRDRLCDKLSPLTINYSAICIK